MNKRDIFLYVFFAVILITAYWGFFPETLAQMEATDFFVWDNEFLFHKLAEAPGFTAILTNYLQQLFRWYFLGALVLTLPLFLIGMCCALLPWTMGRKGIAALGLVPPLCILLLAPFDLELYLQSLFFFASLLVGLCLRDMNLRRGYIVVLSVLGFFLMAWPLLVLAIIFLSVVFIFNVQKDSIANIKTNRIKVLLAMVISIVITVLDVYASNSLLGFIPFEKRFLYSPAEGVNVFVFIGIFILALLLMFVPRGKWKGFKGWVPCIAGSLAAMLVLVVTFTDKELVRHEHEFYCARLADLKDWNKLLAIIPKEDLSKTKVALVYALLAEAGNGTLPDHLFNYSIVNTADFYYPDNANPFCCNFNRQFYERLYLYDEAFRQAVQYGRTCKEGICFASLRQMVYYAVKEGDIKVAEKYLDVLENSSFHSSWVRQRRAVLRNLKDDQSKKPLINDAFMGTYPLSLEMIHQMAYWPTNKRILDYALCGLLLERQLGEFAVILNRYPIYNSYSLPRAYAEALIMVAHSDVAGLVKNFECSKELDKQFGHFYADFSEGNENAEVNSYRGSYWFYYYLTKSSLGQVQSAEAY